MDILNFNRAFVAVLSCFLFFSIVHHIDALEYKADYYNRARRAVTETESEEADAKCEEQKEQFAHVTAKLEKGERLEETHVFANESKFNLALAWAGMNDDGTLIVLTTTAHVQLLHAAAATLWRSTNHGRTWTNISEKVNHEMFRNDDGLQRNPHNPKKVYLIGYAHFIYVTEDGGESWNKRVLTEDPGEETSTSVDDVLEFHQDSVYEDNVAVVDNKRRLLVTYDNFQKTPTVIKSKVHAVKWGTLKAHTEDYVYAATGDFKVPFYGAEPALLTLERYNGKTKTWKPILHRVKTFNVEGKFMYASIYKSEKPKSEEDDRLMMISTDGGDTWREAQLPTLAGDRDLISAGKPFHNLMADGKNVPKRLCAPRGVSKFFSVLDMSEDLIFMHVDNAGDTGHGILYTSSSKGIVYSESLVNHLYPNYNTIHDFYKVKSIRGVYLASQMGLDKSIHTVITYAQGAEWQSVPRPAGVNCENGASPDCSLQIHNAYSIHRGITARQPHSIESAPGLVLVHAHVATNLQTTPPDVYLSSNGGYSFKRVLKGPHAYEITDSGGLLVAISLSTDTPDTIKFSTDEGNCWHTYKFTDEAIHFTGLLTEPGGKSMTISIWGYTLHSKKWTVNIIDFNTVVNRTCKVDDYTDWTAHSGCLLGLRETFEKLKPDSWCRNGYFKSIVKKGETCPCKMDDYECDFGFYRKVGETKCRRQEGMRAVDLEICNNTRREEIISVGYRKLPGDICDHEKGFKPKQDSIYEDLGKLCKGPGDKSAITHDAQPPPKKSGSPQLVIIAVVSLVVIVVAIVGAFFLYKLILLRRHKTIYRYSMLNQGEEGENEFENALVSHDTLYHDTSDEEVEQENRSPKRQNGQPGKKPGPGLPSYHDDSDDDMLG